MFVGGGGGGGGNGLCPILGGVAVECWVLLLLLAATGGLGGNFGMPRVLGGSDGRSVPLFKAETDDGGGGDRRPGTVL